VRAVRRVPSPAVSGIDLHVHTVRSDGTFTPAEAVRLAAARGLSVVAVTDHDTTEGVAEAGGTGRAAGVEVVPGVEFSAMYQGASIHVLGYWMNVGDGEFQAELQRLREDRFRRGERMVEKLQALGYGISFERVKQIAGGQNIIRPHVAQAMVEAGIVPTEEDAFTGEFIADGGRADVPKHALDPLDALALIRRAGGVCVLAHPGMWGNQRSVPQDLIEAMAQSGMAGLEADHPDHPPEQRVHYRELARRLGVVATGSSDCHGTRYDPVRLGTVTTPADQFARLRELAGR
jgi:3',5'-nucleoside bisphosphate phosphatase